MDKRNRIDRHSFVIERLLLTLGHGAIVRMLCATPGVDVNLREGSFGATPLLLAAERGHVAVCRVLLGLPDVHVHHTNNDGATALHMAAANGHVDAVLDLMAHTTGGPEIRERARQQSASAAPPRAQTPPSNPALHQLHAADSARASMGHAAVDCRGRTPLFAAAERGHADVVAALLALPCVRHANQLADHGNSALAIACLNGHTDVAGLLLRADAKCNTNLANSSGATPLFIAAAEGHVALVRMLCCHPSTNVNTCNSRGWTPLVAAAHNGHGGCAAALLASGRVSGNEATPSGTTPLIMATAECHTEIAVLLSRHPSVDVNSAPSAAGHTAVHIASMYGRTEILSVLLAAGGCRFRPDAKGNSALALARDEGVREVFASGVDYWRIRCHGSHTRAMASVVLCLLLTHVRNDRLWHDRWHGGGGAGAGAGADAGAGTEGGEAGGPCDWLPKELWLYTATFLRSADFVH